MIHSNVVPPIPITSVSKGCVCPLGYIGDEDDKCVDRDECANFEHNCDLMADCLNTIGSFECNCINGYEGNGLIKISQSLRSLECNTLHSANCCTRNV